MSVWFCLGSGPSQCQEDIDAIRGRGTVIAINNQLFAAPWADHHYVCDPQWFEEYRKLPAAAEAIDSFGGQRWCTHPDGLAYGCRILETEAGEGLGRKAIRLGSNSGYQAINFAWLMGATTIVLLGYDMQHTGGRHHNHDDHPRPLGNFCIGMPELCRRRMGHLAADLLREGVRVINCSRETALRCFERKPLSSVLAAL